MNQPPVAPITHLAVRRLVAAAATAVLLAGCGSGDAPTPPIGVDLDDYTAAELAPQSPDLPYPCSLLSGADFAAFLDAPTLDRVRRDRVSNWATGCSWEGSGGTRVAFRIEADMDDLNGPYGEPHTFGGLGDQAAYVEEPTELDDGSAAIARTMVATAGPLGVAFTVQAADPDPDDIADLTALTLARLATATSPLGADGKPQLGDDRRVCEEVVTRWERTYGELSGAPQKSTWSGTTAAGKTTRTLVEWAGRIAPERTYPDLRSGFEALAAAVPGGSADPTHAQVTAVRDAVVAIGTACAVGGVTIDWLPG